MTDTIQQPRSRTSKYRATLTDLDPFLQVYCQTPFATSWRRFEGGSYPRADKQQMETQCFRSAWLSVALHEVYARLGKKEESQQHLQIFERLNREDQNKDRQLLQESLKKQKDSGTSP